MGSVSESERRSGEGRGGGIHSAPRSKGLEEETSLSALAEESQRDRLGSHRLSGDNGSAVRAPRLSAASTEVAEDT